MSEQDEINVNAPSGAPTATKHDTKTEAINSGRARETVIREVSSWNGVVVGEHRFGGVEFRIGARELGHVHGTIADLPFPKRLRDELISAGRARPHHVIPNSGWITVPMKTGSEAQNVIELFRQNYERAKPGSRDPESETGTR